MIKDETIIIKTEWRHGEGFLLWAEDEQGIVLPIGEWKHLAFTWHEASAYGTFVQEDKDDHGYLWLSNWMALDYFASKPEQAYREISFSNDVQQLREAAGKIQSILEEGRFKPNADTWQKGSVRFKAEETIETGSDFPSTDDWLTLIIMEMLRTSNSVGQAWDALLDRVPMLKTEINEDPILYGEEQWLKRVGWKEDRAPFTTALRLIEPVHDGGPWRLAVLLVDKQSSARQFEWEEEVDALLPYEWQAHTDKIDQDRVLWLQIVPWLEEDGQVKMYLDEEEALTFLTETSETLANAGVDIFLPPWWEEIRRLKPKLKAQVRSSSSGESFFGIDTLLQFDWKVATGDLEMSDDQFRQLVEQNRRLVKIDGKWVHLDSDFIRQIKEMKKQYDEKGLTLHDVFSQAFSDVDHDRETAEDEEVLPHIEIELNRQLKTLTKRLAKSETIPLIDVPDHFRGELRPYQIKGSSWLLFLRKFGLGGCLADDMGLGKTIQAIVYLLYAKQEEKNVLPSLIICPTSVLTNWQKEFERFAPSLRCAVYHGSDRPKGKEFVSFVKQADVVLTTYNIALLNQKELISVAWSSVILDEAQNIKNSRTKQARAVRQLSASHRIALTGTPIENRLTELWSIFQFLNPGYLGSSASFQGQFITPIERHNDGDKTKQLQQLIHPFLLRRTKQDEAVALDLPEKQELKNYCYLTSEQASLYEQLVQETFARLDHLTGMERRGLIFSMLTRLKQLCDHPGLYLKEDDWTNFAERSDKVRQLLDLIEELRENGESCLIFTQYVEMGKKLQAFLGNYFNGEVSFLHGGTPQGKRGKMIDEFQTGKQRIFILSLKAGGTGLNLTAANHVIHFDRWWNPAVENQATDRAHRIGQDRFVQVHKMITTGTLEEKIDEMIEKKRYISEQIIGGEQWITELSTDDLRELFALRTQWVEG
jgi:SNF2 family DNA or RNA helicase